MDLDPADHWPGEVIGSAKPLARQASSIQVQAERILSG
jgi:hypothetical protein